MVSRVWPQGVRVHDRSLPHRFADCKVPIVEFIAVHITLGSAVSPYRSKFADCMAGAVPNSYPKLDLLWDNVIAGPWGTPRKKMSDSQSRPVTPSCGGLGLDQSERINWCTYFLTQGRCSMSTERANDLARACTELVQQGRDFPTIWATMLKSHTLVEGIPHQRLEGMRSLVDTPLITGERLVFDGDAKRFSVG